jgi:hypothetical protein
VGNYMLMNHHMLMCNDLVMTIAATEMTPTQPTVYVVNHRSMRGATTETTTTQDGQRQ